MPEDGQTKPFPYQPLERGRLRLCVGLGQHSPVKRRQLAIGVRGQTLPIRRVKCIDGGGCQLPIERLELQQQRRAGLASRALRCGTHEVESADDFVDSATERERRVRTGTEDREPGKRPLEMSRERRAPRPGRSLRDADGATPVVERVEDVVLTKLDPNGPPAWPLPVVTLEIPIDTRERHFQRNPFARPTGHLLERRTDDSDQMTVVLPTEVGLYFAAIVFGQNTHGSFCVLRS